MFRLFPPLPPLVEPRKEENEFSKISKKPAGRFKKGSWCPSGPGQGLGSGPPGQGGRLSRTAPFCAWWTRKGGTIFSTFGSSFFAPNCCNCDYSAAERIRKEVMLTLYIYIYIYIRFPFPSFPFNDNVIGQDSLARPPIGWGRRIYLYIYCQ